MSVTFIGTGLNKEDHYAQYEKQCWHSIIQQIEQTFPNQQNLLISLTWFGPQFDNFPGWQQLLDLEERGLCYDNLFFLATVDPPYLNVIELQEIKNKVQALNVFYLGNFDSPHQFNFFAPILAKNFKHYDNHDLVLESIKHIFVNYNRKPKQHRVDLVKMMLENRLDQQGIITLGRDATNDLYLTLNEKQSDYVGTTVDQFGLPMDYYTLHRIDIWKNTFLYVNAATEFNPINDLFCQQDTFKPMLGLRPFVINGVQRTYRWLRNQGFRTFNQYWSHIDIESGPVHETIVELLKHLAGLSTADLLAMYNDMLPDLLYNKQRFYEFADEQAYITANLFKR